jgi:hypothetical protein
VHFLPLTPALSLSERGLRRLRVDKRKVLENFQRWTSPHGGRGAPEVPALRIAETDPLSKPVACAGPQ